MGVFRMNNGRIKNEEERVITQDDIWIEQFFQTPQQNTYKLNSKKNY